MSEGYNNFENGSESNNTQYTQAPSGNGSGYSYGGPVNDYSSGKGQGKGLGIASMVCGILSIVLVCCSGYIGFAVLGAMGGEMDYNELLRQLEDIENSLRIRL